MASQATVLIGGTSTRSATQGLTSEDVPDRINGIGLAMLNLELTLYPTTCFLS
ncbi:hypothetical protein [Arthrobacter psychrochitiniphilus]|uniref:hypothetical protein n=1 Tax=Arthrobacter psychrochitiniphilus TaxID=291045 RepID=UPI003F7C4CF9